MNRQAKPYSEACERNRKPIYTVLRHTLADAHAVLEIGSGTGQHAVYFAARMPWLRWLTSDLPTNHAGIRRWLDEAGLANVASPLELEVCRSPWPALQADAVYSANTAHIMSWREVCCMFAGVGNLLAAGQPFCLYGPFCYGGRHTSASNEGFDRALRAQDSSMGVRDVDELKAVAHTHGLRLAADHALPANNRLLEWRKQPRSANARGAGR